MLRAPPSVVGRVMQLDSLYLVTMLGVNLLNLIGAPVRPLTDKGRLGKRKPVAFLHSLSGNVNRLAYGTSVLHAGGGDELVDAVTVTVVAGGVNVIVPVAVITLVMVLAESVVVVVLVQNSVLLQPIGQRCLGPMVQP